MAHELRAKDFHVIVADMGEYLNLAEPIQTESLLLMVAAALADGAERILGGSSLENSYPQRLWDWLTKTEVNLSQVSANFGHMGFTAQLKTNPGFRDSVAKAIASSPGTWFTQVKEFAAEVVRDIKTAKGAQHQVVLILDSLERLRVSGSDAQVCYDAIQQTFDLRGEYLKLAALHVVYSVPPYLPFLSPRVGAYFGVEVCTLPHVKVFEAPDFDAGAQVANPFESGVALLIESAVRRYGDIEKLIAPTILKRLALASSGSVRDFFRLLKSVCTKALTVDASLPIVDHKWPDLACAMLRAEMPVALDDMSRLAAVRECHGDALDTQENLPKIARLFDGGLILNYRNGRPWCDAHYLLHPELPPAKPWATPFAGVSKQ